MRPKMRPPEHADGRLPALPRSLVLAALLVVAAVSMVALAPSRERRRQAPLTPPLRRGRSPAEGAVTRTQGFSDRHCGCSWIAPVTCDFRDRKRSLLVVVFGYLDGFCDHKVSKRSSAPRDHYRQILHAGGRVASRRSGAARPRASSGAAVGGSATYAVRFCPRVGVW